MPTLDERIEAKRELYQRRGAELINADAYRLALDLAAERERLRDLLEEIDAALEASDFDAEGSLRSRIHAALASEPRA